MDSKSEFAVIVCIVVHLNSYNYDGINVTVWLIIISGDHLAPLGDMIDCMLAKAKEVSIHHYENVNNIELIYSIVVSVLSSAGKIFVPSLHKGFFKFWWDENLSLRKQASVDSNRAWKAAGRPRQGQVFSERQTCRKL